MASPERFEVPVSHLTTILPEEGHPHQKNKTWFFSDRLGLIYFEVLILSEVVFLF